MYAWKDKQHTWIGVWMHCEIDHLGWFQSSLTERLVESGADYGVIKLTIKLA